MRLGHLSDKDGKLVHLIAGEFQPKAPDTTWTPFVTIRTSGYEQWIGAQASAFLKDSRATWDNKGDLSATLQQRLEGMR